VVETEIFYQEGQIGEWNGHHPSPSLAKQKRIGDKRSPCLTLSLQLIKPTVLPLKRREILAKI